MPNRCVVVGCSNIPDLKNGIALHAIPYWGDDRLTSQERRRKWVEFVQLERANWQPTKWSVICSKHFNADDFQRRYYSLEGFQKFWVPRLKRDDLGVNVFPSRQETVKPKDVILQCASDNPSRSRRRRKERRKPLAHTSQTYHQLKETVISLRTRLKKRKREQYKAELEKYSSIAQENQLKFHILTETSP